jgi:tetratricopeptide (TPR) repeat protein
VAIAKAFRYPKETIKDSLQALASSIKPWLLILDNADDPEFDYSTYFPSGHRGAVIITSRISNCRKYSTVDPETLEGLTPVHSKQLLLKAAEVTEDLWPRYTAPAEEIVQLLGSHTLALIQAGAYIAEGYCELEQYPEKYRQKRKQLLEHHPNQEQSRYQNVYATFEASVDVLRLSDPETGKDALELLAILSVLHFTVLPLACFEDASASARTRHDGIQNPNSPSKQRPSWRLSQRIAFSRRESKQSRGWKMYEMDYLNEQHKCRLPELINHRGDKWDDYRLNKASVLLASLSLVTRHRSGPFEGLSMHPLAHAWAKDRLDINQQQQTWISSASVFAFSRKVSGLWQVHERLMQPHMQALFSSNLERLFSFDTQRVMLPIMMHCGWLLFVMREYKLLQALLECIYKELKISPWSPSNKYLPIWSLAARNQVQLRNNKLAIALLEFVTNAEKTLMLEANPERLISQYNLAVAYDNAGISEKAVPILEYVIHMYKTMLPGELHSMWLASSEHELARAYNATGHPQKGVHLMEGVVKLNIAQRAPQSRLLASQHALATAYNMTKQTNEALSLLEHVTKVYESSLEETHPSRQSTQYELARAYFRSGETDKAVALLERVVKVQSSTLEETNNELVASQFMLALIYSEMKREKDGLELLEHVVRMYERTLDETHADRLKAEFLLGLAYVENGDKGKARKVLEHVVAMRRISLESTHDHRIEAEKELADLRADTL